MAKRFGSPNMSDTTLLVSVEDLINLAMGPAEVNVVNFKMIQAVLHILARQLRMLETQVEIRISEAPPRKEKTKEKKKRMESSTDSASSKSPRKATTLKGIQEETTKPSRDRDKERATKTAAKEKEMAEKEREKAGRAASKEREKADRAESKESDKAERASSKEREKADRAESKERDKAERASSKEREKADRAESKERDKAERASSKEREKAERAESKERDKAERASSKEREKADKTAAKEKEKGERAESKEREKAEKAMTKDKAKSEREEMKDKEKGEKAKEKEARAESKEREKTERAESKEREKAEKEKEKMEKMSAKDREKAEKEKEKMEKMSAKDREKAEKEREKLEKMDAKDREKAEKEREKLEKMDAKEREKAEKEKEKLEKMSAKDREKAEKEREKLEKMDAKEREKAEKEKEKLEKMDAKEREKAEKEKEKLEKMSEKDREKAEKEREKLEKMDAKEREKAEKEKEKLEKMDAKDRAKAEKEIEKAAKEKEKLDKMSAKERDKYEKELAKEKAIEEKGRTKSAKDKTGISIKEQDKVLIVEKGPTTRTDSRTRVGSIEVVTVSQFEILEAIVKDLKGKAGPLPFPALPDNKDLRAKLAEGSASLTDTMQAMQVTARVQAAEAAIGRMAGLLTQLAAAGALPQDVAGKMEDVKAEMDAIAEESAKTRQSIVGIPRKSVAIDPMSKKTSMSSKAAASARASVTSRASVASKASAAQPGVTHVEMDGALISLKDALTKNVNNMTAKATSAAEGAAAVAKAVSDKLDIALKLNSRINTLYSLVTDYAEQLNGFDAGLVTQMQSFQEQMAQMRNDLKGGINLLESANNNAETAAVTELTERYEGLVSELDHTQHEHLSLTAFQKQLGEELRSLLECVEMLREQKADRDEVLDGLRDKADNSRLAGLLTELEFATSRAELERRLELCYDKFKKQEHVWMGALKDLTNISEGKAEIMQLLAAKEDAQEQLRDIQDRLQKLATILGEPKAAMLTRQLSKGARCGACQIPALQEPTDTNYGKPSRLPAFRPPPAGEEQPCISEWKPSPPPDEREHTCHRWVGGSHTLLAESVVRVQAGPMQLLGPPTKRYTGFGNDGRLYLMEEELQPCKECNVISTEDDKVPEGGPKPEGTVQPDGAGDTVLNKATVELPA